MVEGVGLRFRCIGHSSTQALHYSAKGSIIYPAGALCIVQDLGKHEQKFFSLHTDLVTCIKVRQVLIPLPYPIPSPLLPIPIPCRSSIRRRATP